MTCQLLDINLLIALAWPQHVHHAVAHEWFNRSGRKSWATCPLTQIGFVRISSNPRIIPEAVSPQEAVSVLLRILALPGHHFWPDLIDVATAEILNRTTLVGHRQVTDAYLLSLAMHNGGQLATLDKGIAALLSNAAEHSKFVTRIDDEE